MTDLSRTLVIDNSQHGRLITVVDLDLLAIGGIAAFPLSAFLDLELSKARQCDLRAGGRLGEKLLQERVNQRLCVGFAHAVGFCDFRGKIRRVHS